MLQGDDTLLMVGPLGDTVEFPVAPPVVLVPERDGVRVISDERHELLRRVPAPLADVYRVGSTTPGDTPGTEQNSLPLVLVTCCGGCWRRWRMSTGWGPRFQVRFPAVADMLRLLLVSCCGGRRQRKTST